LFHPATGHVRVKGVTSTTNVVIHTWLKAQLADILAVLPPTSKRQAVDRTTWERWRTDARTKPTLLFVLSPLHLILVLEIWSLITTPTGYAGVSHRASSHFYPTGGNWLNMAEVIQRLLKRCALDGQHYFSPQAIIDALEAVVAH